MDAAETPPPSAQPDPTTKIEGLPDLDTAVELRRMREVARYAIALFVARKSYADRYRYYCAAPVFKDAIETRSDNIEPEDSCAGIGVPALTFIPRPPQLSVDPSLTALAQLGALKLDCERAFISIIDHDAQYVLAEATRSHSLELDEHADGDGLCVGSQALPIYWGICPSTIKTFTDSGDRFSFSTANAEGNRTRYIIKDLSKEETYKSRLYVTEWPFMRFYAEVPMMNKSGFVIGSYCVIDSRPKPQFGDKEVRVLQEITSTISNHLELTRKSFDYDRAERLMKGLSSFVDGQSSVKASSTQEIEYPRYTWSDSADRIAAESKFNENSHLELKRAHQRLLSAHESTDAVYLASDSSMDGLESPGSSALSSPASPSAGSVVERPMGPTSEPRAGFHTRPSQDDLHRSTNNASHTQAPPDPANASASNKIKETFQRASTLIREGMDISGVVFFEAIYGGFSHPRKLQRLHSHHSSHKRSISRQDHWTAAKDVTTGDVKRGLIENSSLSSRKASDRSAGATCEILGVSEKTQQNSSGSPTVLPAQLLYDVLSNYPHGHVFTSEKHDWMTGRKLEVENKYDSLNSLRAENADDVDIAVFNQFSNADSVIFYPLWDSHKARWCAGCFGWTTDPKRVLQETELTYLAAFGNSVMAELGRLEAVATGKAKTDFISNISHELRSPLHGILASAELLQESSTGPDQDSMIEMVNYCGRTLLDTMNHLLDYAKINNFAKTKKRGLGASQGVENPHEQMSLVTDFDLRELVEEVVEAVHAGHIFQKRLAAGSSSRGGTDKNETNKTDLVESCGGKGVRVILDVPKRADWAFSSQAGAWRRLVMNLFGNALKYTSEGFISVGLRAVGVLEDRPELTMVQLSIADSGRGISDDYLKHRLYTPFSQEDHLSVGAGLGLSIVQQIVEQLSGTIDIESQVEIGTTVTVTVPLESSALAKPKYPVPAFSQIQESLSGLTLCMVGLDSISDLAPTSNSAADHMTRRNQVLQSSLSQCLTDWFGLRVIIAKTFELASANLFLVEEGYLACLSESWTDGQYPASIGDAPIIVLSTYSGPGFRRRKDTQNRVVYLDQPYGPSKLARVLDSCLNQHTRKHGIHGTSQGRAEGALNASPSPEVGTPELSTFEVGTPEVMPAAGLLSTSTSLPRLLLVDDNPLNLTIMVTYMRKLKCSYVTASDGLQALQTFQKEAASNVSFDFVLMDVSMPVMDGLTATSKIRAFEQENKLKPTKIIALTGLASNKARLEASACGVDLFLTKPTPLKVLKVVLGIT